MAPGPFDPGRFWDAFERAGILEAATFHLAARGEEAAREVPLSVDYSEAVAPAFDGDVRGTAATVEYLTASLPLLTLNDQVTVRGARYRIASHPTPLVDGDYSLVELGAVQ